MSIAVLAVVKPSRMLLALSCAMCVGTLGVAIIIGFGMIGDLPYSSRILIAGACIFVGFSVLYQEARRGSEFHVHITGVGQIRFAEWKSVKSGNKTRGRYLATAETGARLMAGSTIWPSLLLLRLRLDNEAVITVSVLPDCLPVETFRSLAVACRWIAAHEHTVRY